MTTILAAKKGSTWTWGWDSLTTYGPEQFQDTKSKVFRNGQYIFGVAGSVHISQTIQYANLPDFDPKEDDPREFAFKKLVPAIKKAVKKEGWLDSADNVEWIEATFLVQVGKRVFEVTQHLTIIENSGGVMGVGSGARVAELAYKITKDVKTAMKWAVSEDAYTGGKVHVRDSEDVK